ncbi:hypothetical protein [Gallaecimonas sp. GXIMD4217]|uniref:YncE family protein n=1 Tax=Gallaecimonas sp. GXIMD4217 TaxID=3131927 RepID=UPI00311AC695
MKALHQLGLGLLMMALAPLAGAEILAMLNYESKPPESLKEMKQIFAPQQRREGIAILDVDPDSPNYGQILMDLPLPADLVAHHIFYNRDATKAYVTALGRSELRVIDLMQNPYRIKVIPVPECQVGEDVVFSGDNKRWYLTCMGSQNLMMGDAVKDELTRVVALPEPYPHGISIHDGLDRLLVTSTVSPTDMSKAGDTITVIEASTGKVLGSHRVSHEPAPSGAAPVEILFKMDEEQPLAYISNMGSNSLWVAKWRADIKDFEVRPAFDFAGLNVATPLELYFNPAGDRLYVTTGQPGHLHIFDVSGDASQPRLLKSIRTAEGAHHVAFTKDWRYAYVQNALLNLPGMSDGSVTLVDLAKGEAVDSIDTLKDGGYNPNCIVLLPDWNHPAGH